MNREEKIYQMIGTLEYLYSRLKEERKIYNDAYYCLLSYNNKPELHHLIGNETYKRWERELEISKERKNELLKSIEVLTNEMLKLDYQMGYYSEYDYFKEFDY